jgi:hypothetical protein
MLYVTSCVVEYFYKYFHRSSDDYLSHFFLIIKKVSNSHLQDDKS